jgi:hypothetical protein
MSFSPLVVAFTAAAFLGGAAPADRSPEDARTIIRKLEETSERQRRELCGYSVTRQYTLHNKHLTYDARLTFLLTYRKNAGKTLKLLSSEHANGIARRAMLDLVSAEPKVKGEGDDNGAVDETNYKFTLLGQESPHGRLAYRFNVVPKRSSKLLVNGDVWIDAADYAVVRIKGQLSKSVSFWVGRPDIEQEFAKFQGFWMPSYNRSVSYVKLAGEADLTIEYSNYRFEHCSVAAN